MKFMKIKINCIIRLKKNPLESCHLDLNGCDSALYMWKFIKIYNIYLTKNITSFFFSYLKLVIKIIYLMAMKSETRKELHLAWVDHTAVKSRPYNSVCKRQLFCGQRLVFIGGKLIISMAWITNVGSGAIILHQQMEASSVWGHSLAFQSLSQ